MGRKTHHEQQKKNKARHYEAEHVHLSVLVRARLAGAKRETLLRFYTSERAHRVNTENLPVAFVFREIVKGRLVE